MPKFLVLSTSGQVDRFSAKRVVRHDGVYMFWDGDGPASVDDVPYKEFPMSNVDSVTRLTPNATKKKR